MATVTIKNGVNQVIYTGAAPLVIGTTPLTANNVRIIYKASANNQGYVSNTVAGSQAIQPFKQLVAAAPGALPQGYIMIALRDFTVDGALFGLNANDSISWPLFTESGTGPYTELDGLVDVSQAYTPSFSFSSGSGSLQMQLNGDGNWMAPARIPLGSTAQFRIQHTVPFSGILTLAAQ